MFDSSPSLLPLLGSMSLFVAPPTVTTVWSPWRPTFEGPFAMRDVDGLGRLFHGRGASPALVIVTAAVSPFLEIVTVLPCPLTVSVGSFKISIVWFVGRPCSIPTSNEFRRSRRTAV